MTTAVAIVPMAPEHIESFHRTLDAVARERRFLTLLEAFPLPDTSAFVLGNIERGEAVFVAVADEEVVGWCDIIRQRFPSHAHRGSLGIGLLPAFRGQGLGRKLMTAAIAAARRAGVVRIELSVHADNDRAISLYERLGFVREGVTRDAFLADGRYRDALNMALIDRSAARPS